MSETLLCAGCQQWPQNCLCADQDSELSRTRDEVIRLKAENERLREDVKDWQESYRKLHRESSMEQGQLRVAEEALGKLLEIPYYVTTWKEYVKETLAKLKEMREG